MQRLRLMPGLWIRMIVASAIAVAGITALLALEFVVAALLVTVTAVVVVPMLAVTMPFLLVASIVVVSLWFVVAAVYRRVVPVPLVVGRIAHDGLADALEPVAKRAANPADAVAPTDRELVRFVALSIGLPILAFVGFVVAVVVLESSSFLTPVRLVSIAGMVIVCAHTGWVVSDEIRTGGTVTRALEERVRAAETDEGPVLDGADADIDALQARVDRLASQAGVPSPTIRLGRKRTPIAASVGYRPETSSIIVSRGLLEALGDRELEAVLAHELSHVINRDAAILTALSFPAAKAEAGLEPQLESMKYAPQPHPIYAPVLVLIPIAIAGRWAVAVIARYREYVADRSVVALTGDPAALASALETLDTELERRPSSDLREHRSTAAFSIVPPPWEEHRFFDRTRRLVSRRLLGTHPPTENRIERLRESIDDSG